MYIKFLTLNYFDHVLPLPHVLLDPFLLSTHPTFLSQKNKKQYKNKAPKTKQNTTEKEKQNTKV